MIWCHPAGPCFQPSNHPGWPSCKLCVFRHTTAMHLLEAGNDIFVQYEDDRHEFHPGLDARGLGVIEWCRPGRGWLGAARKSEVNSRSG